jgi:hypothetical protein
MHRQINLSINDNGNNISSELDELTKINYLVSSNSADIQNSINLITKKLHDFVTLDYYQFYDEYITNPKPNSQSTKYLLITFPENDLHPADQKIIPELLHHFAKKHHYQIFVFTNSPFIVASLAEVSQKDKEFCDCNKYEFRPQEKVYIIKSGQIVHRSLDFKLDLDKKPKGRYGYWGKKANFIASQMLNIGLENGSTLDNHTISTYAPILVLCEGSNSQSDAQIYSNRSVLFISCQGTHELGTSFDVFRQIKKSLSADFQLCMLRDRDHEFPDQASIDYFHNTYPGRRVLSRRAIECYLYNSEVAELLLQSINLPLNPIAKNKLDEVNANVQMEAENGVTGHDYKDRLKNTFLQATSNYSYTADDEHKGDTRYSFTVQVLAPLVKKTRTIHKQLADDIFGSLI